MVKLNKLIIPVVAISLICSLTLSKNFTNNQISNNNDANKVNVVTLGTGDTNTSEEPTLSEKKIFKGIDKVKSNTPYKIKQPTNNMDGLTLEDADLDIHKFMNSDVHIVNLNYKGDKQQLYIQQVDSTELNPLVSEATETITLKDGTKAAVYDPMNGKGFIHILFSKDGKSYDIEGINLGKDRLKNIAESLREE